MDGEYLFRTKGDFLSSLREKYPEYADVQDGPLYDAVIEKYPEYAQEIEENFKQTPADAAALTQTPEEPTLDTERWVGPAPSGDLRTLPGYKKYASLVEKKDEKRGFVEGLTDWSAADAPLVGGFFDAKKTWAALDTYKKLERGEKVPDEELLSFNTWIEEQRRLESAGWTGKAGDILRQQVKFWSDIAIGTFALGSVIPGDEAAVIGTMAKSKMAQKVAQEAAEGFLKRLPAGVTKSSMNALQRAAYNRAVNTSVADAVKAESYRNIQAMMMRRLPREMVKSKGGRAMIKLASGGAEAVARGGIYGLALTAVSPNQLAASTAKQQMRQHFLGGDDNMARAVMMGILDTTVQMGTEQMGYTAGKAAAAIIPKKFHSNLIYGALFRNKAIKTGWEPADAFLRWANMAGANGLVEEIYEERLAGFASGLFGLEGDNRAGLKKAIELMLPDAEQLKAEALAFAIPGIAMGSAAYATGTTAFGGVGWEQMEKNMADLDLATDPKEKVRLQHEIDEAVTRLRQQIVLEREQETGIQKAIRTKFLRSTERKGSVEDLLKRMNYQSIQAIVDSAGKNGYSEEQTNRAIENHLRAVMTRRSYVVEDAARKEEIEGLIKSGKMKAVKGRTTRVDYAVPVAEFNDQFRGEGAFAYGSFEEIDDAVARGIIQPQDLTAAAYTGADVTGEDGALSRAQMIKAHQRLFDITSSVDAAEHMDLLLTILGTENARKDGIRFRLRPSVVAVDTADAFKNRGYSVSPNAKADTQLMMYIGASNANGTVDLSTHSNIGDMVEDYLEAGLERLVGEKDLTKDARLSAASESLNTRLLFLLEEERAKGKKADPAVLNRLTELVRWGRTPGMRFEQLVKFYVTGRLGVTSGQRAIWSAVGLEKAEVDLLDSFFREAVGKDILETIAKQRLKMAEIEASEEKRDGEAATDGAGKPAEGEEKPAEMVKPTPETPVRMLLMNRKGKVVSYDVIGETDKQFKYRDEEGKTRRISKASWRKPTLSAQEAAELVGGFEKAFADRLALITGKGFTFKVFGYNPDKEGVYKTTIPRVFVTVLGNGKTEMADGNLAFRTIFASSFTPEKMLEAYKAVLDLSLPFYRQKRKVYEALTAAEPERDEKTGLYPVGSRVPDEIPEALPGESFIAVYQTIFPIFFIRLGKRGEVADVRYTSRKNEAFIAGVPQPYEDQTSGRFSEGQWDEGGGDSVEVESLNYQIKINDVIVDPAAEQEAIELYDDRIEAGETLSEDERADYERASRILDRIYNGVEGEDFTVVRVPVGGKDPKDYVFTPPPGYVQLRADLASMDEGDATSYFRPDEMQSGEPKAGSVIAGRRVREQDVYPDRDMAAETIRTPVRNHPHPADAPLPVRAINKIGGPLLGETVIPGVKAGRQKLYPRALGRDQIHPEWTGWGQAAAAVAESDAVIIIASERDLAVEEALDSIHGVRGLAGSLQRIAHYVKTGNWETMKVREGATAEQIERAYRDYMTSISEYELRSSNEGYRPLLVIREDDGWTPDQVKAMMHEFLRQNGSVHPVIVNFDVAAIIKGKRGNEFSRNALSLIGPAINEAMPGIAGMDYTNPGMAEVASGNVLLSKDLTTTLEEFAYGFSDMDSPFVQVMSGGPLDLLREARDVLDSLPADRQQPFLSELSPDLIRLLSKFSRRSDIGISRSLRREADQNDLGDALRTPEPAAQPQDSITGVSIIPDPGVDVDAQLDALRTGDKRMAYFPERTADEITGFPAWRDRLIPLDVQGDGEKGVAVFTSEQDRDRYAAVLADKGLREANRMGLGYQEAYKKPDARALVVTRNGGVIHDELASPEKAAARLEELKIRFPNDLVENVDPIEHLRDRVARFSADDAKRFGPAAKGILAKRAPVSAALEPAAPAAPPSFLGYRGGFSNAGKGTAKGDGKDQAMRSVANAFIGELAHRRPSSTLTSAKEIGAKAQYTPVQNEFVSADGKKHISIMVTPAVLEQAEEIVVMLARNGELGGKPLLPSTAEAIEGFTRYGVRTGKPVRFVVGDMPGVDDSFVFQLEKLGAKFEIYHAGDFSRIELAAADRSFSLSVASVDSSGQVSLQFSWHSALASIPERVKKQQTLEQQLARIKAPKDEAAAFLKWAAGKTGDSAELLAQYEAEVLPKLEISDNIRRGYDTNDPDYDPFLDIDRYEELSVNKGQGEYMEYFIRTPFPVPGQHGAFKDPNLAGWFRVREYGATEWRIGTDLRQPGQRLFKPQPLLAESFDGPSFKTREEADRYIEAQKQRDDGVLEVQEIQSELFQKNRGGFKATSAQKVASDVWYGPESEAWFAEVDGVVRGPFQSEAHARQMTHDLSVFGPHQAAFLNLMLKDQTWVSVFIQAITQWARNKGFEKVRFPTGETAARVEGHQVLADRLTELQDRRQAVLDRTVRQKAAGITIEPVQELARIDAEINEFKTQGIEKLAPIEAFYEKRVASIVNRMGAQPVTDANGNTWREVNLQGNATFSLEEAAAAGGYSLMEEEYWPAIVKAAFPDASSGNTHVLIKNPEFPATSVLTPRSFLINSMFEEDPVYYKAAFSIPGEVIKNGAAWLRTRTHEQWEEISQIVREGGASVYSSDLDEVSAMSPAEAKRYFEDLLIRAYETSMDVPEHSFDAQAWTEGLESFAKEFGIEYPLLDKPELEYQTQTFNPFIGFNGRATKVMELSEQNVKEIKSGALGFELRDIIWKIPDMDAYVIRESGSLMSLMSPGGSRLNLMRDRTFSASEMTWENAVSHAAWNIFRGNRAKIGPFYRQWNPIFLEAGAQPDRQSAWKVISRYPMMPAELERRARSLIAGMKDPADDAAARMEADMQPPSGPEQLGFEGAGFSMTDLEDWINPAEPLRLTGHEALHKLLISQLREQRSAKHTAGLVMDRWRIGVGAMQPSMRPWNRRFSREELERGRKLLRAIGAKIEGLSRIPIGPGEYAGTNEETGRPEYEVEYESGTVDTVIADYEANRGEDMMPAAQLEAEIRQMMEQMRQRMNEEIAQFEGEEWIRFIENYLMHKYRNHTKKDKEALSRRMARYREQTGRTESRWIDTYEQAARYGFTPKTLDAAELYGMWVADVNRVKTNRVMLSLASGLREFDGAPVIVPIPSAAFEGRGAIADEALTAVRDNLSHYLSVTPPEGTLASQIKYLADMLQHRNPQDYQTMKSNYESISSFMVMRGPAMNYWKMFQGQTFKNPAVGTLEHLNAWMKWLAIGIPIASMFHPFALLESWIATKGVKDTPLRNWKKSLNEALADAERYRQNPEISEVWIKAGLQVDLSHPDIVGMGIVNSDIAKMITQLREAKAVPYNEKLAEGLSRFLEFKQWWDTWLWNRFHPTLKLMMAEGILARRLENAERNGDTVNINMMREDIARYVNDAIGGQEWEQYVWATPQARQLLHLLMFAPDWTFSSFNVAGLGNLPILRDIMGNAPSVVAKDEMLKQYWPAMALLVMFGIPNALQMIGYVISRPGGDPDDRPFTFMNEPGKRTHVDITPIVRPFSFVPGIGYKGGETGKRRVYLRWGKQAWEVFDGWITQPWHTLMGKSSQVFKTAFEQATGSTVNGWDLPFKDQGLLGTFYVEGSFGDSRLGVIAKKFSPYFVLNWLDGYPSAFFAPASRGASKAKLMSDMEAVISAFADEPTFMKAADMGAENKLRDLIPQIWTAAERNGFDGEELYTRSLAHVRTSLYRDFFEAINTGKQKKAEQIAYAIVRLNGTMETVERSMSERFKAAGKQWSSDTLTQRVRAVFDPPFANARGM